MVLKSAKWCMMTHSDPNWTWIRRLGCICASCAKLSWQPSGWKLCWTCKQHVSSVSATRLPNVTQNAFFAFSSGFFQSKYGWCKWWTWREQSNKDIDTMETRYQGSFNPNMMGNYCWFLQWSSADSHNRKSKSLKHFWTVHVHCIKTQVNLLFTRLLMWTSFCNLSQFWRKM